jgi:acyl-CoA synthetase (NDP forming)
LKHRSGLVATPSGPSELSTRQGWSGCMTEILENQTDRSILERLRPLFFPRSIAVVGVSKELWKPGAAMLKALRGYGFSGSLYAVGRAEGEVLGFPLYQTISSLPEAVDLTFLFVPAKGLPAVVKECREKGVRAVVAFAGGFAETGTDEGKALEAELKAQFDGRIRMVGPNCLGLYCPKGHVTQHPGREYPIQTGEVAFVAQSGGLTEDFIRATPSRGFFASKVVSYGNATDLNEADLLEYLGADPDTGAVGMYIEGPRDRRKLREVLKSTTRKKPVVVWRGGLTPEGARAAGSHTGSLAGGLEVWEAMIRQAGAIRVTSLEEMLDTLQALHFLKGQDDPRVGYVCSGGGYSVAASDACHLAGLSLPRMSPATESKIASFLLPVGTNPSNPVDVFSPFPTAGSLKGVLQVMAGSGEVGAVVMDRIVLSAELRRLMNFAELLEKEDDPWLPELPVQIKDEFGLPVIVVLREDGDPRGDLEYEKELVRLRTYYHENGVATYPTAERAFRALGQVVGYYRWRATATAAAAAQPAASPSDASARDRAVSVIQEALARGQENLSEHQAKQVLDAYDIPVTKELVVGTAEELSRALLDVGFPVVLKIESADILHKTEGGLVELGCKDSEEAAAAFHRIMANAKQQYPAAHIEGVLVEEMVAPAMECIVGMKVDPQFGPVVMFGLGGIFVEVFDDVSLRVAPLGPSCAAAMVRGIRGYRLLSGARGQAKADLPAIEHVLVRMSALALDLEPHISEIDINPLMVLSEGRGAVAADALVVLNKQED